MEKLAPFNKTKTKLRHSKLQFLTPYKQQENLSQHFIYPKVGTELHFPFLCCKLFLCVLQETDTETR